MSDRSAWRLGVLLVAVLGGQSGLTACSTHATGAPGGADVDSVSEVATPSGDNGLQDSTVVTPGSCAFDPAANRLNCPGRRLRQAGGESIESMTVDPERLVLVWGEDEPKTSAGLVLPRDPTTLAAVNADSTRRAVLGRVLRSAYRDEKVAMVVPAGRWEGAGVQIRESVAPGTSHYSLENRLSRHAIVVGDGGGDRWGRSLDPKRLPIAVVLDIRDELITAVADAVAGSNTPPDSAEVDVPRAVVETGEHEIRVIGGVTRLGIVHQPIPEPVLQDIKAALATEQDFFLLTQALDLADVLVPLVSDLIGVIPGGDCAKGAAKSIIASLASTIATLVELYPQAATATTGETAQALLADVVQKAVGGATEAAESAVIGCAAEVIPVVQVLDAIASIGSVFATVVDVGAGAYDSAQNPAWATVVLPLAISLPSDTGTLEDVCPTGSPVWVALATTVGDASGYLEAWVNALDAGETAAACVGDGFAEARDYRGDILHLQADGRLTVATCWPPSAATVRRLDETLIRAGRAYGYANAAVPAATLADVLAHPTAMFAPEPAQLQRVWFEGASRCAQQTGILTVPAEYASLSLVGISASRQSDDYNLFANQFRIGSVDFPPVHTGCAVGPHWLQVPLQAPPGDSGFTSAGLGASQYCDQICRFNAVFFLQTILKPGASGVLTARYSGGPSLPRADGLSIQELAIESCL